MNYGIPYKGSKSKIAKDIIDTLPSAENFYDLFAGGCAMTHCAMLSEKYKNFIVNDINQDPVQLFSDAINGKFKNEKRWIDRETFEQMKYRDPYIRYCWSFGSGGENYLYSKEIEPLKKWLHYIFFAETPKEARLYWKKFVREFQNVKEEIMELTQYIKEICKKHKIEVEYNDSGEIDTQMTKKVLKNVQAQNIRNYMREALTDSGKRGKDVDNLLGANGMAGHYFGKSQWMFPTKEAYGKTQIILPKLAIPWDELNKQLQRLERLERLQSLERHSVDYQNITIKPNSVIYCDIPYKNTSGYNIDFDYDSFYKWACEQVQPVFISEYYMPEDRFTCIWQKAKVCSLGAKSKQTTERLFVPKKQYTT